MLHFYVEDTRAEIAVEEFLAHAANGTLSERQRQHNLELLTPQPRYRPQLKVVKR